jgi:hypothetical protein
MRGGAQPDGEADGSGFLPARARPTAGRGAAAGGAADRAGRAPIPAAGLTAGGAATGAPAKPRRGAEGAPQRRRGPASTPWRSARAWPPVAAPQRARVRPGAAVRATAASASAPIGPSPMPTSAQMR